MRDLIQSPVLTTAVRYYQGNVDNTDIVLKSDGKKSGAEVEGVRTGNII
jgi:hypothetical protein|tara:strand:+ start:23283 stop:23429 length:147 start_codon:yes stop_codon:yes gene_type:complete